MENNFIKLFSKDPHLDDIYIVRLRSLTDCSVIFTYGLLGYNDYNRCARKNSKLSVIADKRGRECHS